MFYQRLHHSFTITLPLPLQFPETRAQFQKIAADFEAIWKVSRCVGSIAVQEIRSGPPVDHYNLLLVVDATLRVWDASAAYGPMIHTPYDKMLTTVEMFAQGTSQFPAPREATSPYTFVGCRGFTATKSLRVPSSDPSAAAPEQETLLRALKPAEVTLTGMLARFGVLKKYRFENFACAVTLHNYFVHRSAAYVRGLFPEDTSSLVDLVGELRLSPDWHYTQMGMNRETFDLLLRPLGPRFRREGCPMNPETRLAMVLRLLVTGQGYTPERERMFVRTFFFLGECFMADFMRAVSCGPHAITHP